jgi:hypothetical protein
MIVVTEHTFGEIVESYLPTIRGKSNTKIEKFASRTKPDPHHQQTTLTANTRKLMRNNNHRCSQKETTILICF